jgi:O-antigen chain-terminating methyltransferase
MIEANNIEIDVDELMQKIREEVYSRQINFPSGSPISNCVIGITPVRDSQIEALLNDAELYSQVPTEFPAKFNRFPFSLSKGLQRFFLKLYGFLFKKQRVVNLSVIQSLRESVAVNQQLIDQVITLQSQLQETSDRLRVTDERLAATSDRLRATGDNLIAMDERLKAMDERLKAIDEHHISNDNYLKNDLSQQKRLITLFLEEARQRLPEPFRQDQLQAFLDEEPHLLDAFYVAFEEQFRGNREEIFHRLKVYLPLIEQAKVGTAETPILDVGCGRGEWLQLLKESGYIARGLDTNRVMLEGCKIRGLEVIESDVIAYLQSLPEASLGGVTGFHIIEHLPFPVLIKLLDETVRVLKPGGLAIFETPNPQNVLVSSQTFYLDPTHRNPLPSSLMKFLAESQGLGFVKIMNLNPYPENVKLTGTELAERFSDYFYGSQDYAVLGYKF